MRSIAVCLALLLALVVSGAATRARAESGALPCRPGALMVAPAAGDVPANWPFFEYSGLPSPSGGFNWTAVRLERVRDGVVVPTVSSAHWPTGVAPLEDLVPGEDYDLYQPLCYSDSPRAVRYHAVAPIAAPSTLGTITVSPLYGAYSGHGSTGLYHFVDVVLAPEAGFGTEPWASSFRWSTEIDGTAGTFGIRTLGDLTARIPVTCSVGSAGVPGFGDHSFRGVAFVVQGATRFSTPAVATSFSAEGCAAAPRVDATTLRPLTADEIAFWETPEMDAGVPPDCGSSMDGGRLCTATERDTNSNCAVAVGRRGGSLPWALLGVVVLGLAAARRRR